MHHHIAHRLLHRAAHAGVGIDEVSDLVFEDVVEFGAALSV
ncbi:hypothetical protein [Paracoccus rhizosphaerae]|uniref:Uncharacterized protein n=1 Tax=Paracoccus rhizosphaerae TaxID=1133347 RepID=A0ABV6CEF0_9RHOB|nr:hypothetical protein [Paracoccus rhizosphaerae]